MTRLTIDDELHGVARSDSVKFHPAAGGGHLEFESKGESVQYPPADVQRAAQNLFQVLFERFGTDADAGEKIGTIRLLADSSRKQVTVELKDDTETTHNEYEYRTKDVTHDLLSIYALD